MLTTTYSIVVLSAEQQRAYHVLRKLEQCLRSGIRRDPESIDLTCLRKIFARLVSFDQRCHERKVERYVIPALRKMRNAANACNTTAVAGVLLERLDGLSVEAVRILRYVRDQVQRAVDGGEIDIETLVVAMRFYCAQASARLSLEEAELFPMARRLLSNEEWFRIAACCLSDSAARHATYKRPQSPASRVHGRRCQTRPVH